MTTDGFVQALIATGRWSANSVRLGIRARFRCEYCDCELLDTADHYKAWTQDHIVPRTNGGGDGLTNLALACYVCNFRLKGRYDPRRDAGHGATRSELISAVRQYVKRRRDEAQKTADEERRLWESVRPADVDAMTHER